MNNHEKLQIKKSNDFTAEDGTVRITIAQKGNEANLYYMFDIDLRNPFPYIKRALIIFKKIFFRYNYREQMLPILYFTGPAENERFAVLDGSGCLCERKDMETKFVLTRVSIKEKAIVLVEEIFEAYFRCKEEWEAYEAGFEKIDGLVLDPIWKLRRDAFILVKGDKT